jgi:glycolate oxidase iron-sulfur subunit
MSGIKELTRLMKELEVLLSACTRCGVCQSVCPVFAHSGHEADVARGKMALLEGLAAEMFKSPKGVSKRLERCLLCGACESNCASGVKSLEIFFKARAILAEFKGLSKTKRAVFRNILARPKRFDSLIAAISKYQNLFIKPADDDLGTSCARVMASPLLKHRHFKPLAQVPFHQMAPLKTSRHDNSGIKVAFFTGCLIDKIFPNVAKASLEVLNYHEVEVFIPRVQGCCGIPALSSGDTRAFSQLVQYNLDMFGRQDFDFLITSCATCTSTIKKIWPMMMENSPEDIKEKVNKIAEKTLDISRFLVSEVGVKKLDDNKKDGSVSVTIHDPCHLKKSLDVFKEPRILIEATPGYQLIEMQDADQCCGMGGSFNIEHYDVSSKIGEKKADSIFESKSSVVATGCPACMVQISDLMSKAAKGISVKHVIEIYAEGLKML